MSDILFWILCAVLTLLVGLITLAVCYARWHYGELEKIKGLNVVTPYFIGGSDPFFYKKICCDEDTRRVKKFGKIFGFYDGRSPHIYISDTELIRLIFIKDFDHFHNKRIMNFGHPLINEMIDILPYEKWKVVRNCLSPQLTTGKIRTMSYQMLDAINDWMGSLSAKVESNKTYKFNPKEVYTGLTIEVIARCAFATKINAFDDEKNLFAQNIKRLMIQKKEPDILWSVAATFPFLQCIPPFLPKEVMDFFGEVLTRVLRERRTSGNPKINDFVDVMNDMIEKSTTSPEYKKLGITETTAMCQAMFFLIAGFETTTFTLTMMSYYLAKSPNVQQRLLEEVDDYLHRHGGKIEHETIAELVYLNASMNETLRLHSPLIRIERVCVKKWLHGSTGLIIQPGTTVQVPISAVHLDEINFEQPEEFRPERFLPENKEKLNPYAFLSFGQGPHNCIGMKFAKEEIQMAMATILEQFRFEDTYNATIKIKPGRTFLNSYEPIELDLVKRG